MLHNLKDVYNKAIEMCVCKISVGLEKLKFDKIMSILSDNRPFTVVCLVAWSLNESEAGVDRCFDRDLTAFLM